MNLQLESYVGQLDRWPADGRHILAQFDEETVIVYQAYRPAIGDFAAEHGYFGGPFKLTRMSWIKPNFLWMMYRSGWAMKEGQEVVLAIRLKRSAFDQILSQAVHSSFVPEIYENRDAWQAAVKSSNVRLQFDPDHNPFGHPAERRAIQLGLRGEVLAAYAKEWIVEIQDISEFVGEQQANVRGKCENLFIPKEEVYVVEDETTRNRLRLDRFIN